MIEEPGRVVAVEGKQVWVETIQQSSCGGCAAKSTCGQGLVAKYTSGKRNHIRLVTDQSLRVGDQVVLGIPENTLLKSAFLAYGLPLLLFIAAAGVADSLFGAPEPWVIGIGILALCLGFVLVRLISGVGAGKSSFQPLILKVLPATEVTAGGDCIGSLL